MPSHVIGIEDGISTSRLWVNIEHFYPQDCLLAGAPSPSSGGHAKGM